MRCVPINDSFTSKPLKEQVNMEKNKCKVCCNNFSRIDNLKRHQRNVCKAAENDIATANSSNIHGECGKSDRQRLKDPQLSSFVDSIINEKPKTIKKNPQLSAFANAIINGNDKSKKHTVDGMQPQEMFISKRDMIGPSSDEEESMMLPLKKQKRLL